MSSIETAVFRLTEDNELVAFPDSSVESLRKYEVFRNGSWKNINLSLNTRLGATDINADEALSITSGLKPSFLN